MSEKKRQRQSQRQRQRQEKEKEKKRRKRRFLTSSAPQDHDAATRCSVSPMRNATLSFLSAFPMFVPSLVKWCILYRNGAKSGVSHLGGSQSPDKHSRDSFSSRYKAVATQLAAGIKQSRRTWSDRKVRKLARELLHKKAARQDKTKQNKTRQDKTRREENDDVAFW